MATNIEWTDETWNPIVGCSRVSAGCANCYADLAAKSARLQQFKQYQKVKDWDGTVELVEHSIDKPLQWKTSKRIFICSMSDLFHENIPDYWRNEIFNVVMQTPHHIYQVVTKRPQIMQSYFLTMQDYFLKFYESSQFQNFPLLNLWLLTTVESQAHTDRIEYLINTPAKIRGISCEPLLSPIDLSSYLHKLDWVIVGGESGSKARPCNLDWIQDIVDQCSKAAVPCFVKQLGQQAILNGDRFKTSSLKNGDINQFPASLQVQDFPV